MSYGITKVIFDPYPTVWKGGSGRSHYSLLFIIHTASGDILIWTSGEIILAPGAFVFGLNFIWGFADRVGWWMCGVPRKGNIGNEYIRRLPKRLLRDDWTGTGMCWGEMKNTYWGKCWGQIYQGRGREDDRKQDGEMRVNEIWKVLDWERARRRTGRCREGSSAVTPATLYDGKSQGKRIQ